MADKIEPPPTPTARDRIVKIASTAAGELPVAGTVVEALRQIFGTHTNTVARPGFGASTSS